MSKEFWAIITVGIALAGLIVPLYGRVESLDNRIDTLNQRITRVEVHLEYLTGRHQEVASVASTDSD